MRGACSRHTTTPSPSAESSPGSAADSSGWVPGSALRQTWATPTRSWRSACCNSALPWRSLSVHGVTYESHIGRVQHPAEGTLEPNIETELGEPVVAAWVSPDGVERRYVVPAETPWPALLQWLLEQALPEYVPGAMRRARPRAPC